MASSLAAQLAPIAATASHQLDLKAQRKAHSQSFLFDSQAAAKQDFETIYQICVEGYQELCRIDPRFRVFAKTIFGEQSKQQERSQMTEHDNDKLNTILESFLSLISSRLLLAPAKKAIEWLIRRFRLD